MLNQISSATNEQFYQMQKMSIQRLVEDTSKRELVIGWSMKSDRKTFAEMYCDFSNTDLREKIKEVFPGNYNMVFEFSDEKNTWAGFGKNNGDKNMFDWIKKNWKD